MLSPRARVLTGRARTFRTFTASSARQHEGAVESINNEEGYHIMRKSILFLLVLSLLASLAVGPAALAEEDKPVITITSIYFSAEVPEYEPITAALEEITGYQVEINWIPTIGYEDKINTMLASDSLSMITTFTNLKSTAYLNAVDDGLFWELDDYIADYENIMKMGDARFANVKRNGSIMGVPRGRDLVRQGIIYRQDWAEEIGFTEQPQTVEDIDTMIRAFAERSETSYGIAAGCGQSTNPSIPEGVPYLAIYMGAPHTDWGYDESGEFTHSWLTEPYTQAVEQFATWYADGLMNKNFLEISVEDSKKLMNTEETGFIFCYCDDMANRFADLYVKNADARLWYALQLNDTTFGTQGFNGTLAISKSATGDEETLKHCLTFIDRLGDTRWQDIISVGLEGEHYTLADGYATQDEAQNTAYSATGAQYGQINCYGGVIMPDVQFKTIASMEALKAERLLYVDTCKMDPTIPFVSDTNVLIGTTELDPIRCDAINKYIMGEITKEEYEAAQQRWLDAGGADVIAEFKAQIEA